MEKTLKEINEEIEKLSKKLDEAQTIQEKVEIMHQFLDWPELR